MNEQNKQSKEQSIRREPKHIGRMYVSEQKLKFYVNAMKYQKYLKELQENPEEFRNVIEKSIKKKIKLLKTKESPDNKEFVQKNIEYYQNLKLDSVEDVLTKFNLEKNKYLDFIFEGINRIENNKNKTIKKRQMKKLELLQQEAKEVEKLTVDSQKIRENFGEILVLTVNKILKMPKFSGYTNNWKEDFFINSVEKVLQYVYNFDDNLLSLKTGKPSTAFNYLTQIIMNAIIAVINKEKKNSDFLKRQLENNSISTQGVFYQRNTLSNVMKKVEVEKIIKAESKEEMLKQIESLRGVDFDILKIFVTFSFDVNTFEEIKKLLKDFNNKDIQLRMSKVSDLSEILEEGKTEDEK